MIAFIDDHRDAYGVEPICRVLPTSARSSPICRPMAIAAFMLCCAGKPRRPGAKRPIRNASTAS